MSCTSLAGSPYNSFWQNNTKTKTEKELRRHTAHASHGKIYIHVWLFFTNKYYGIWTKCIFAFDRILFGYHVGRDNNRENYFIKTCEYKTRDILLTKR